MQFCCRAVEVYYCRNIGLIRLALLKDQNDFLKMSVTRFYKC